MLAAAAKGDAVVVGLILREAKRLQIDRSVIDAKDEQDERTPLMEAAKGGHLTLHSDSTAKWTIGAMLDSGYLPKISSPQVLRPSSSTQPKLSIEYVTDG